MNTETGTIYRGDAAINAARERGEPIVEVSGRVAELMEMGNREERRRRERAARKAANKAERQARGAVRP